MNTNEFKPDDLINTEVEIPPLSPVRERSDRQKRQQLLARLKFQAKSMQGNLGPLRQAVVAYNNSVKSEDRLRTVQADLSALQSQLSDLLLEINEKFAIMKLETWEKQNQPK